MNTQCHRDHGSHNRSLYESRRDFLCSSGVGFGAVALAWLMQRRANGATTVRRGPHHPPRAKSVIWLFMEGGPSHLDLVDPKPLLNQLAGQPLPAGFSEPITAMGEKGSPLLAAPIALSRQLTAAQSMSITCSASASRLHLFSSVPATMPTSLIPPSMPACRE